MEQHKYLQLCTKSDKNGTAKKKNSYNYVQTWSDPEKEDSTNIYSRVHTQDQTET